MTAPGSCLRVILAAFSFLLVVLFLAALSLPFGLLNHIRGGWLEERIPNLFPSNNGFTHDFNARLIFGGGLAVGTAVLLAPSCNGYPRNGFAFLVFGLALLGFTTLSLFTGWGSYFSMGHESPGSPPPRAGVFDWTLGKGLNSTSPGDRWLRDATGMALRGLEQSSVPGFIIFLFAGAFVGPLLSIESTTRKWLFAAASSYSLSGAAMALWYEVGWSIKTPTTASWFPSTFAQGVGLSELLWGWYVGASLLIPLAVLSALPIMAHFPSAASITALLGSLPAGNLLLLLTWPCRRLCSVRCGDEGENEAGYQALQAEIAASSSAAGADRAAMQNVLCPCLPIPVEDEDDEDAIAEAAAAALEAEDSYWNESKACCSCLNKRSSSSSSSAAVADNDDNSAVIAIKGAAKITVGGGRNGGGGVATAATTGAGIDAEASGSGYDREHSASRSRCPSCLRSRSRLTCTWNALFHNCIVLYGAFLVVSAVWYGRTVVDSDATNKFQSLLGLWVTGIALLLFEALYLCSIACVRREARKHGVSRLEARDALLARWIPHFLLCACVRVEASQHDDDERDRQRRRSSITAALLGSQQQDADAGIDDAGADESFCGRCCLPLWRCCGGLCCGSDGTGARFACRCGRSALDAAAHNVSPDTDGVMVAALGMVVPERRRTRVTAGGTFTTASAFGDSLTGGSFATAAGGASMGRSGSRSRSLFQHRQQARTMTGGGIASDAFLDAADAALTSWPMSSSSSSSYGPPSGVAASGSAGNGLSALAKYENVPAVTAGRYPAGRTTNSGITAEATSSFSIGRGKEPEDHQGRPSALARCFGALWALFCCSGRGGCCGSGDGLGTGMFRLFLVYAHRSLRLLLALQLLLHVVLVLATVGGVVYSVVKGYALPGHTDEYWPW